ncbi:hypothetical protein [Streptomyces sp. NPDC051014]|uniref:hypothetical protein n=1 Tax=Streptomyces sp. NPDC051014 TaxID=3155751 RepID=UPI0034097AA9
MRFVVAELIQSFLINGEVLKAGSVVWSIEDYPIHLASIFSRPIPPGLPHLDVAKRISVDASHQATKRVT